MPGNLFPTCTRFKTLEITNTEIIRNAYRNRLKNLENSVSSFTLNIVFKKDCFKYFKTNYYVHNEGRVWTVADYTEENWPLGYALFLSANSKSEEYADGMTILTYMKYEEVAKWESTFNTVLFEDERGKDYDAFKIRKAENITR